MTEADLEKLSELEFRGGLYMDEDFGPCLPSHVIEGTIIAAAKKRREGPKAKAGFVVSDNVELLYEGPRDPEELWKDEKFVHKSLVSVNSGKVLRTRPIFNDWSAVVECEYDDELTDKQMVTEWFKIAGAQIGFCDYRPKFGRCQVEILNGAVK